MARVILRSADRPDPEGEPAKLTFDAVYQTHAEGVARWVARLSGPGADVEDLTQEIFLVVNRRLAEFRHESQVATWLFSITTKIVANDRRRRRLRRWWVRLVPRIEDHAPPAGETPIEHLEKRERRAHFYQALDTLAESQRRALVLFELEDLSVAEIAQLMDRREGNVRVLLHRARAAFLRSMTAHELQRSQGHPGPSGSEQER
jgi:RNA polymerase sigma-70 factor (ECF subfamily)